MYKSFKYEFDILTNKIENESNLVIYAVIFKLNVLHNTRLSTNMYFLAVRENQLFITGLDSRGLHFEFKFAVYAGSMYVIVNKINSAHSPQSRIEII